jgi:hypothetical protein
MKYLLPTCKSEMRATYDSVPDLEETCSGISGNIISLITKSFEFLLLGEISNINI